MRFKFILGGMVLVAISSCTSSRNGCYTRSDNYNNTEMKAASSLPRIPLQENKTETMEETILKETENISASETLPGDEETDKFLAMIPPPGDEDITIKLEGVKTQMAEALLATSLTVENKFASRILNKTASRIGAKHFTNQKPTLFNRLKTKISEKIYHSVLVRDRMEAPEILSIVSLVLGLVAFGSYWGSFGLGIAAIVTGAIALRRDTPRRGMAIVGVVFGALAVAFWTGFFLFY